MAIGRIGSYGSNYGYYQIASQMRLHQALEKNTKYQQSLQAVQRADRVSSYTMSNGLDFIRSYSSEMADVMSSANSLRSANTGSTLSKLDAVSSDTSVADVSVRYASRMPKEMTLDVQSLAEAQVNVSSGVNGSEKAVSDMDFAVDARGGSVSVNVSAVNEDGSERTNREMLREAAKQINAGNTGVRALVTEKEGVASLSLKSNSTGTDGAFTVSGDMGAASGAEEASTAAANAQYSVTSGKTTRDYTSQTNDVTLDSGRISAKLKDAGETKVSLQADNEKVADTMSDLVDSYNNAVKFLENNTDHGSGVSTQLNRFKSYLGSDQTLDRLGITKESDGTLSLNTEKLTESLKKEPELTRNLISGSNGFAQNIFNKASSAMRTNSESLINYDLEEVNQASIYDPLQYMGTYSRFGTTQMNNYSAIGLMMNYLV